MFINISISVLWFYFYTLQSGLKLICRWSYSKKYVEKYWIVQLSAESAFRIEGSYANDSFCFLNVNYYHMKRIQIDVNVLLLSATNPWNLCNVQQEMVLSSIILPLKIIVFYNLSNTNLHPNCPNQTLFLSFFLSFFLLLLLLLSPKEDCFFSVLLVFLRIVIVIAMII